MAGTEKILLINPPLAIRRDFIYFPYFSNLGIYNLAGALKKLGLETRIRDSFNLPGSSVSYSPEKGYLFGVSYGKLLDEIAKERCGIVVVNNSSFLALWERNAGFDHFLKKIKEIHDCVIILADLCTGGNYYEEYEPCEILSFYKTVDYLVKYEPDTRIERLILGLLEGETPDEKVLYPDAPADLDTLPLPDYKSLATKEFGNFLESLFANGDFFNPCGIGPDSLPVQFSRGCAKNPPYRVKSLARIEEELNSIAETGHTRRLCVIDAEANLRGDFKELLRLLKRYRISFDFLNGLTADEIDEETAMLLSGSVTSVSFPVNSEKNRDTIAIENAFSACSTQGIASFADVTIGLPGETARDINGILDLAYKAFDSYGTEPLIHFPVPLRGSGFSHSEPGFDPADAYNLPLFDTGEVKRDELKELKRNFIKKIHASGTRKLIINLTYRCNNHCIFCAVGNRSSVDGDTEVQKKILLDYARKGVRMLDLDGGEPTIFKDVLKIIKFARELGYKSINVTTNGRTLSYPQVAEKLLKSGITSLLISLHGHTREIHTLHTRVQESFAQTLRGIQNAIINNFFEVRLGINTTISAYNYKHLKELAKFIISLGIQRINFQLITPFGRASNEIVPDPGSAAAELKKVIDEYASRIKISVINLPLCFMRGYEEFLIADLFKLERNMFFVTNEDVNLYKYLAKKRRKTTECGNCAHALICDGFYTFEDEGEAVGCAPVATI